jgi:hypothetical protein
MVPPGTLNPYPEAGAIAVAPMFFLLLLHSSSGDQMKRQSQNQSGSFRSPFCLVKDGLDTAQQAVRVKGLKEKNARTCLKGLAASRLIGVTRHKNCGNCESVIIQPLLQL